MQFRSTALRILVVFCCACAWPLVAEATTCSVTTVSSLLGTTCTIGDVSYSFIGSSYASSSTINGVTGPGISANSLNFTPDGSDPLHPIFSITGPLGVSASGSGNASLQSFNFFWSATATSGALQIATATNTLVDPSVPSGPGFGTVSVGNNFGIPTFTNAQVLTGGPNTNPSSAGIDLNTIPSDGFFALLFAMDGTGNGATASVSSAEYQYSLVSVPEPSCSTLLSIGLLSLASFTLRSLLARLVTG